MRSLTVALALLGASLAGDDPHPSRALIKPKPVEVVNLAEGRRIVLTLTPEGTQVKKGQVIAELDSAAPREALANQEIATKLAEAQFQIARTSRESVEKTYNLLPTMLIKYTDKAKNDVKLGEAMVVEGDRRVWEVKEYHIENKEMWAANKKVIADETLKIARVAIKTHEGVTRPSRTKESDVLYAQAQSDELAKFEILALEQAREKKLRLQIEHCKLAAPADGVLMYAHPADGRTWIEEGATVRERQVLARILPPY